jgi:hypothetical protein
MVTDRATAPQNNPEWAASSVAASRRMAGIGTSTRRLPTTSGHRLVLRDRRIADVGTSAFEGVRSRYFGL